MSSNKTKGKELSWFTQAPSTLENPVPKLRTMKVGTYEHANARRANQIATAELQRQGVSLTGPGSGALKNANLTRVARKTEEKTGLLKGSIEATQSKRGNVYVSAVHTPVKDWGGEGLVRSHLSLHRPSPTNSAIGQFHVKTETFRENKKAQPTTLLQQARIVPKLTGASGSGSGGLNFSTVVTPVSRHTPALEALAYQNKRHPAIEIASEAGKVISEIAQQRQKQSQGQNRGSFIIRRGGKRKTLKHISKKNKTRKHH